MRLLRPLLCWLLLLAPLTVLPGCERDEPKIASYIVAQPEREALRLLTAIVPADKVAFVVKLGGPAAEVGALQAAFVGFVESIRIDDKNPKAAPTWQAPAGWKERAGGPSPRIASFYIDGPRPLEVVISVVPPVRAGKGEENSLLDNLNRWRGQLELPPAEPADVEGIVRRIKSDGRDIILADMTGTGAYRRPAAEAAVPANPHAGLPKFDLPDMGKRDQREQRDQAGPFRFTAPASWEPLRPLPSFAFAAFQIVDGKSRVKVSASMIGGTVADNVERWRGQLGLPKVPAAALNEDLRPIRVAGLDGRYADLVNPRLAGADNRFLGILVPTQGTNLILKMWGPDPLVGQEKARFEAFAASFQPARE